MWRIAKPVESETIVQMCRALNQEDPCQDPVPDENMRRTLRTLQEEPARGRALVLELDSQIHGYALLITFWSNELGGEVCFIDELYVGKASRGQGHGTALVRALTEWTVDGPRIWPYRPTVVELEVSPDNARARELYSSLGFKQVRNSHLRIKIR